MTRSVEEYAQEMDMPTWKVAQSLARLIKRGDVSVSGSMTTDEHVSWLERTYPKPENVKKDV